MIKGNWNPQTFGMSTVSGDGTACNTPVSMRGPISAYQ